MDPGLLGERPALGWPIRQHSFLHGRTFSLYSTWCPSERHLAGFVIHKDSSFYIERCSRICITFINGYIWKNVHMLFISDADGWNTQWGFCSFLGGWGWRWLMTCHVSGVVVGDGGAVGAPWWWPPLFSVNQVLPCCDHPSQQQSVEKQELI